MMQKIPNIHHHLIWHVFKFWLDIRENSKIHAISSSYKMAKKGNEQVKVKKRAFVGFGIVIFVSYNL